MVPRRRRRLKQDMHLIPRPICEKKDCAQLSDEPCKDLLSMCVNISSHWNIQEETGAVIGQYRLLYNSFAVTFQ